MPSYEIRGFHYSVAKWASILAYVNFDGFILQKNNQTKLFIFFQNDLGLLHIYTRIFYFLTIQLFLVIENSVNSFDVIIQGIFLIARFLAIRTREGFFPSMN